MIYSDGLEFFIKGMLPAFIATILYSARELWGKKLLNDRYSNFHVLWGMRVYGIFVIPIIAYIQKVPLVDFSRMTDGQDWILLMFGLVTGLLGMFLSYYSLSRWNLSETVPLTTIGPVVTAFVAYAVLGESLNMQGYLGAVVVITSIAVLQFYENNLNTRGFWWNLVSPKMLATLITVSLFSFSSIAYRGISGSISSVAYILLTYLVGILVNSLVLIFIEKKKIKDLFKFDIGLLFLSMIAVLAIFFNTLAYKTEMAVLVSTVYQTQVLMIIAVGFFFFNERKNIKIRLVTSTLAVVGISVMILSG